MSQNNQPLDGPACTRRKFLFISGTAAAGLSLSVPMPWARADSDQLATNGGGAATAPKKSGAESLLDEDLRKQMSTLFEDVCQWIMALNLSSGVCTIPNTKDQSPWTWVNGNLARVLIAGDKILDRPAYREEALRWLDYLVSHQQQTTTSTGAVGGFWGDKTGPGNLYFADSGTAVTALALGYQVADHARQESYLAAMERFDRFMQHGSREDPQGQGRGAVSSWIIQDGKDKGALGCGYYQGHLSSAPYIISTAVTEVEFLSLFRSINHDSKLTPVIETGIRWLLAQRLPNGEFPYIIDGKDPKQSSWPLDTMTYVSEALIAAYIYQENPDLRRDIATSLKGSVEWLLQTQNENGCWGKMKSRDQERSPGCVTLLDWYYRTIEADPRIAASVRKYCRFLLDPANQETYGYKRLYRTTGFIGLVLANLLKPNVTFQ